MKHWIFHLYNILILALFPLIVIGVVVRWRTRVLAHGFFRWNERWGRFNESQKAELSKGAWWWVHAVSVGEVKAIEPLLRRAPSKAGVRILLSVVTPEALLWAKERQLADIVTAAPIDLPWVVRKVFRRVRPQWFISVESEFWPNLLREARLSGARVALVNGRLSQRSFHSYRQFRCLIRELWGCLDLWAVRQDEDADRFRELGVPAEKIRVTGNIKYDIPLPHRPTAEPSSEGLVLTLGSTREGEEEVLLPVLQSLRQRYPSLQIIWAPRHVERCFDIAKLLSSAGVKAIRKSTLEGERLPARGDVIWDTMGDLLDAYAAATLVVVGGSYVSKGGQNPLEPAALKRAIVFGPSMENFKGIADDLVKEGGARQVPLHELQQTLDRLLQDPTERSHMGERARRVLESRQGATERTLELLMAWRP